MAQPDISSLLRDLGYGDDSPEMKMFKAYDTFNQGYQQPKGDLGDAALRGVLSGGVAGLSRIGGATHNDAVRDSQAPFAEMTRLNEAAADKGGALSSLILKYKMADAERAKKLNAVNAIYGKPSGPSPLDIKGPNANPTGAAPPGAPAAAPEGPLPDQAPMPGVIVDNTPPAGLPGPAAVPQGSLGPAAPSTAVPAPLGVPRQPPAAIPGRPDPNLVRKYPVNDIDLPPLPDENEILRLEQAAAAGLIDEKTVDNARQRHQFALQKRDQFLKRAEVMTKRAEVSPQNAGAIEGAKAVAKTDAGMIADLGEAVVGANKVKTNIGKLKALLSTPAGEGTVGPLAGNDSMAWGTISVPGIKGTLGTAINRGSGGMLGNNMIAEAEAFDKAKQLLSDMELDKVTMLKGAASDKDMAKAEGALSAGLKATNAKTLMESLQTLEEVADRTMMRNKIGRNMGIDALRAYDQDPEAFMREHGAQQDAAPAPSGQPAGDDPDAVMQQAEAALKDKPEELAKVRAAYAARKGQAAPQEAAPASGPAKFAQPQLPSAPAPAAQKPGVFFRTGDEDDYVVDIRKILNGFGQGASPPADGYGDPW